MHLLALRSSSLNSVDRAGIGGSRPRPPFSLYPNFEALSFHLVGSWEGGINPSNMDETRSCERATERPLRNPLNPSPSLPSYFRIPASLPGQPARLTAFKAANRLIMDFNGCDPNPAGVRGVGGWIFPHPDSATPTNNLSRSRGGWAGRRVGRRRMPAGPRRFFHPRISLLPPLLPTRSLPRSRS